MIYYYMIAPSVSFDSLESVYMPHCCITNVRYIIYLSLGLYDIHMDSLAIRMGLLYNVI